MVFIMIVMVFMLFVGVEELVFVDECGVHKNNRRDWARALRGVVVRDVKPGKTAKKTNVIAGLMWSRKKHVAVRAYNHSTTSEFFEDWFEWDLFAYIPEKSLVIMDNASFHRKKKLWEIAERYGIYLLFLPEYSPDFNPIENSWANLKYWLIDNLCRFTYLDFAIEHYFCS
jgi:transposase